MKNLLWDLIVLRYGWFNTLISSIAFIIVTSAPAWTWTARSTMYYFVVAVCVATSIHEFKVRRAKALRTLPVREKDEARALWIYIVALNPGVFLVLAIAIHTVFWIAGLSDWSNVLTSLQFIAILAVFTSSMFCVTGFLPLVPLYHIRAFRVGMEYISFFLCFMAANSFFIGGEDTARLLLKDNFALVVNLALAMLWISYMSAVRIVRAQRGVGWTARSSKGVFSKGRMLARVSVPGVDRRVLLFFGSLIAGIAYGWLMIWPDQTGFEGMDVMFLGMFGGMLVLYAEIGCLRASRSLRSLPFSRHQLTRHAISFPMLPALGLFIGYFLVLVAKSVPVQPMPVLWTLLLLFTTILLALPAIIALGNPQWSMMLLMSVLLLTILSQLYEVTPTVPLASPFSILIALTLCALGYGLTYQFLLTKSGLYRTANWTLNKGVR